MIGRVPRALAAVLLLAVLCILASIKLIDVRYQARKLQATLNEIEQERLAMREQNRRYLIELTAFTDYYQLHRQAATEHAMVFPDAGAGTLVDLQNLPGHFAQAEQGDD
ncbi:MAG: cell division protein FtsL [Betaproteobacteria bacterium AqS2]|uniref:Cell division protein FtsL n=1 Tax=Candidatus Amphirhobacter heronislandensis TaxID=1732024 RepID=A0A930UCX1_9GAMM|nr:cell division protein FtsL [Betaproteobacteria bacterium AqS2]